ncbi:MAG: hypothetical protein IM477_10730 [Microcystis sp. M090S1]|jgi:hypothetical protein|uniref:pYEATS domain-containing protein n=1 Tax=Microcystis sp. M090S1 TaxID=2771135 RepID=UPI002589F5FE|nr:pYEATS domain-containing protein [Microcystis sp. M090S1]MCA2812987.1 hypothetical protein [Microcystis sp. M090S1]
MSTEFLKALSAYVLLFQTILWIALIGVTVKMFYRECRGLLEAVRKRVEKGSSLKAGPVELGEDLRDLENIDASRNTLPSVSEKTGSETNSWEKRRSQIYELNRKVFIAHVISPSEIPGQKYDIFIYLVKHKSNDFSDINYAEFYFGKHWGNRIFREEAHNGLIGVRTSAFGSFLCICRVTFKDGSTVELSRYIDFEMSRLFEDLPNKGLQRNGGLRGR